MSFPTTLDTFTTHASGEVIEASYDNEQQTAIAAVEAKIGVDGSAVTTSHAYKLSGVAGTDKAVSLTGTEALTNKTLTAPKINLGSDASQDIYKRKSDGTLERVPLGSANQLFGVNGAGTSAEYLSLSAITSDEKAALAGTSGTPSATNKFVTEDDVTSAKTASKIARRDANGDVLVSTTPTSDDAAASKTYVGTLTGDKSYTMGVITPVDQTAGNSDNAVITDVSITTGFTPRIIKLTFWGQAYGGGVGNLSAKGIVFFTGTTLTSYIRSWGKLPVGIADGAGSASYPGSYGTPVATHLQKDVDNGDSLSSLVFGDLGSNNGVQLTVTVNSVSSTAFVLRFSRSSQSSATGTHCYFRATWEAWL